MKNPEKYVLSTSENSLHRFSFLTVSAQRMTLTRPSMNQWPLVTNTNYKSRPRVEKWCDITRAPRRVDLSEVHRRARIASRSRFQAWRVVFFLRGRAVSKERCAAQTGREAKPGGRLGLRRFFPRLRCISAWFIWKSRAREERGFLF